LIVRLSNKKAKLKYQLMKNVFVLLSFVLLIFSSSAIQASDEIVKIKYDGVDLYAEHLVKGNLNLFLNQQLEKTVLQKPENKYETALVNVKRYFIGVEDQIIEITPLNYKQMIKKYLPHAPDLHNRLGKKDFQFENIEEMFTFYNEFRVPLLQKLEKQRMKVTQAGS
ncbi:MAG: hypothetical protein AAFO07_27030, partial [Bacteroidota bacterium]